MAGAPRGDYASLGPVQRAPAPAQRCELAAAALRAYGVLGLPALVRAEIDADGDVVLRDFDGRAVAMMRPALDGSIARVF